MALVTFAQAPKQSSDALFRLWGKALSDALTAAGMTKLSAGASSGQIDWAAVVMPSVNATASGYEMWAFSDALHTGATSMFLKLEYGGGTAFASPAIWVTVGTAHDGAGALTGVTTTRRMLTCGGSSATATWVCRVTASTNRVAVWMWTDAAATTYSMYFSLERTHDAAGADTNEGFTLLTGYASGSLSLIVYLYGTGVVSTETLLPALLPSVGTGASGAAVALYPIFPTKGVYLNPLANVLIAFQANVTPGTQISFTYYGATKAFMPLNNTSTPSGVRGSVAATCYLVRDE
jgi:hypothetical protein